MLSHTRLCRPNAVNSHQACVSKVHKYPSHASAMHTRRPHPSVVAGSNPSSTASASISIEVVSGKESAPAGNLTCESGDILRGALLSNKVDLYTTWGKVWQCGGGGQCGTCIVEVLEGSELMSARNNTEKKKLGNKPDSYRLACQANVGDGKSSGCIKIRVKP